LKTEFKIHENLSRCCGSRTCSQYTQWPGSPLFLWILNSVFKQFSKFNEVQA